MNFPRILRPLFVLCLLISAAPGLLLAQATTSLNGRVTDSSGAVVPNATVKLTLEATGAVRQGTTDNSGQYQFSQLIPGRYTLTVSAPQFATAEHANLDLLVSQPATANVQLQPATVTQQVTVSSSAEPLLNTTDATLGNAFDSHQVESLPLDQRNVPDLLSLQPGVTFLGRSDDVTGTQGVGNNPTDSRAGSVNGGRSDQSNITLDGVDVNDINNGYAFTSVLRSTQDSVAEFRVTTSNPNAQEGRSSGAQVALVTRSGSNALHGAAYEYNRSNLLEANDFFNKQQELAASLPNRPESLVRNIFGGAVGGPVIRDRLFYFVNYEGRRDSQGTSVNAGTVPTTSYRAGNLQYEYANAGGDAVYTLTPADIQSMDPQGIGNDDALLQVLNSYPQGNDPTQGDGLNSIGYRFPYTIHRKYDTYIARIDWNAGANGKHTLFWRGNLQNDREPSPPAFPGQPPQSTVLTNNKGFAAGYTWVISPALVNDLRYGLTREGVNSAGAANQPIVYFAEVAQPQSTDYSTSFIIPVSNVVDNFSWTRHNHDLAFGTDIRIIDDQRSSNAQSYPDGQMNQGWLTRSSTIANSYGPFDPEVYGYPAVDFSNYGNEYNAALMNVVGTVTEGDAVYNYTKTGATLAVGAPIKRDYRWNEYEFYGQDTWRATNTLTITYGLRYSYLQAPAETSGTQVGTCQFAGGACAPYSLASYLDASVAQGASGGAANDAGELGFNLGGRYNHAPDFWTPDKNDLGPRLAFAFSPATSSGFWNKVFGNQQSSIRAGYSLVFDHFGAAAVQNFDTTGSYGLSSHLSNAPGSEPIESAPRFTALGAVPQSLLPSAPPGGFPAVPASSGNGSFAISWGLDSAMKTPYSHLFDFSITRGLHNGASIELSWVGRYGHRQLAQEDVAMPINLTIGGQSYFAAAARLAKMARANVSPSSVANDPYWQQEFAGLDNQDIGLGYGPLTATQNVYALYLANIYNETYALYQLDTPGSLPNSNIGAGVNYPAFRYYHDQYSALYAWRSIGYSNFNGFEAVYRQHFGGVQADFNYTFSKSLDITSQAERLGNSASTNYAQIMNTYIPNQLYGPSDYDVRHQINSNFVWDLPFGAGKKLLPSSGHLTNLIVGGWQTTGIVRWTTGFPFEMNNGAYYPTNWDIQGYAEQIASISSRDGARGKLTQRFANPSGVFADFDHALPGQSGSRNPLRGDGYFDWDEGVNKTIGFTEKTKLILRWDMFNITNSVRFDPQSISATLDNPQSFGQATSLLTNYRLAQFAARLEF
ncbi:MAG TPA: carboxypeptidase-like regulatory domain-containing protein [Acidobacteriaceae bacterium]|nr:carboxypeptidase-like regulatory domain-containing protein [Acidobacteriaceae bacterium]